MDTRDTGKHAKCDCYQNFCKQQMWWKHDANDGVTKKTHSMAIKTSES